MDKAILFFDDDCLMCNKAVQWVYDHDRSDRFRFSPLNSALARQLGIHVPPDSIRVYYRQRITLRTDALIEIARLLKLPPALIYIASILPGRNSLYDFLARNRYKWFGRARSCRIDVNRKVVYTVRDLQENTLQV